MRRTALRLAALGAVAALGGCATQADMQYVRQDAREARTLAADAKSLVDSMKIDLDGLRGEIEQFKFQNKGVAAGAELQSRIDALEQRVAAIEQNRGVVAAPAEDGGTGEVAVSPQTGPEIEAPPASAPAEYRDGLDLLRRGDGQGAVQKLREFLRRSPKSDLADNAQYWIGEAYYGQKDYNRAILEFNEVLLRYPKGDKVPAALLRQASAFAELGDKVDARLVLQKLLSEHGDTPEAERGRQKLAELSS